MSLTTERLIPTRATLIQRLKNWQDQSSWQDFFDTYWNLIYGVATKAGLSAEEAEDVVQETLIAVSKHLPAFKYDPAVGSFKAWLLNMTRWRITDQIRKRGQPNLMEDLPAPPDVPSDVDSEEGSDSWFSPELEKIWDAEWENNLLNAATAKAKRRVDPKHYQVFDFCVNKEWPPEKVAAVLSLPISQVYMAKHRVAEAIKQEVERLKNGLI